MTDLKTKEKLFKIECANDFINRTREDIKSASKSFFLIGFRLNEANEQEYYKVLGYDSIEALAEDKFGFGRSTTYGFINVFRRFAERNEHDHYSTLLNSIQPEFKDYDYSKLLEIQKLIYIPHPVEKFIPPQSSVRAIQGYVKYYNKNSNDHRKTLPEWQAEQTENNNPPTPPQNQLAGQVTIDDVAKPNVSNETIHAKQLTQTIPKNEITEPIIIKDVDNKAQTVQTSGLPTSAKQYKQPEYNLNARAGVRAFLNDYKNWRPRPSYQDGLFIHKVYSYDFKTKEVLFAIEQATYGKGELKLGEAKFEVIYFLNAYKGDGVAQITKEQIEQFCAQHKGEL